MNVLFASKDQKSKFAESIRDTALNLLVNAAHLMRKLLVEDIVAHRLMLTGINPLHLFDDRMFDQPNFIRGYGLRQGRVFVDEGHFFFE